MSSHQYSPYTPAVFAPDVDGESLSSSGSTTPRSPLCAADSKIVRDLEIAHSRMWGQCKFKSFPLLSDAPSMTEPEPSDLRLFIGQIKYETTPAQMRWIIKCVSGVTASHVQSRGPGCFFVYVRTVDDARAIKKIHKRILFDTRGVWVATTDEEQHKMQEYVDRNAYYFLKHLPKDMLVVEEPRRGASHRMTEAY